MSFLNRLRLQKSDFQIAEQLRLPSRYQTQFLIRHFGFVIGRVLFVASKQEQEHEQEVWLQRIYAS